MTGLRREQRVPLELPVRIWGMDANKKPFLLNTQTNDITRLGARIGGIITTIEKGEIIGVQHGDVKARAKVCWSGEQGTPREGQIGIHSLEPEKYLWSVSVTEVKRQTGVFSLSQVMNKQTGTFTLQQANKQTGVFTAPQMNKQTGVFTLPTAVAATPAASVGRRLYERIAC